jgi:hypothetical protein
MGYRGKVDEQAKARELRAQSWTLNEIAAELGVAKSSVSKRVRNVDFVPRPRTGGHAPGAGHPMRRRREQELASCRDEAESWVGLLGERDLATFALGLYAGEGAKGGSTVGLANTNP